MMKSWLVFFPQAVPVAAQSNLLKKGLIYSLVLLMVGACAKQEEAPPTDGDDDQTEEPQPDPDTSPEGDVVGKLIVGYQGWFGAAGDGSPFNSWRHWAVSGAPAPGNQSFEVWPDTREYENLYPTGYANLGNGEPAMLFSHWDEQTVNLHFQWMAEYGIDCAAVQRFGNHMDRDDRDRNFKNGLLEKERAAAEANEVKFYVCYDISGWTEFQAAIKEDWTNTVAADTVSPMYARQNGKPVVGIWGLGVAGRPGDAVAGVDVVNWFKDQGCYVIVGTQQNWRENTAFLPVMDAADMVSPWTVGAFKDVSGVDRYAEKMEADKAYLDANGQDYLPVVFPGFAWSNWNGGPVNEIPRMHGDFLWRQFANIRDKGITQAFVAMFDEYDEGTAIAKAAEDSSMIPTDQYFLTLDADGVSCSSDFYLRLTGDGAKMIAGKTPLVWTHPTSH